MGLFDYWRPYPELKTGIVNLKSGTSFRAVIWKVKGKFMVLRNAQMLSGSGQPLDGEVIVQLADIEFIQVT